MQDETKNLLFMFCIGIVFCLLMVAPVSGVIPWTHSYKARVMLEECEQALPRNQHCMISAIPEIQK